MDNISYPKKISNTYDKLVAEQDFGTNRETKQCKRCGNEFVLKHNNQKFCSKQCSATYHIRIREAKEMYGNSFKKWLGKSLKEADY